MRLGTTFALAGALTALHPAPLAAQTRDQTPPRISGAQPGCALTGGANVSVEGRGMLNLGDVQACPGLRYEIIPNVVINGLPAVRLLPSEGSSGSGASSVTVGGAPAARQGDAR